MPSKITPFEVLNLALGVNVHTPDFSTDIELTMKSLNLTSGIYEGIGPRFGMAPLPGQSDTEAVPAGSYPGLMRTEANWGNYGRVKIYAVHTFSLGGLGSAGLLGSKDTYYAVLLSYTDSTYSDPTAQFLDLIFLSVGASGLAIQSNNIASGLAPNGSNLASLNAGSFPDKGIFFEGLGPNFMLTNLQILENAELTRKLNYVSSTSFSVNNPSIECDWVVGGNSYLAGAALAPGLNLVANIIISGTGFLDQTFPGITSDIVYGDFNVSQRNANVYALDATANALMSYRVSFPASNANFVPSYSMADNNVANINLNGITAVKTGASTSYSSIAINVYNDTDMKINASYQGVLVAGQKAYCFLVQDWLRSQNGTLPQYVDLVNLPYQPICVQSNYTENGDLKPGPFGYFPTYTTGTAMATTGSVALLPANSGILRANTTYELAYSVFNKRWNYESNVSDGVKFCTGTNDFVALQLWDNGIASTQANYNSSGAANYLIPFPGNRVAKAQCINHLQYRFYYRQLGAAEWLPALFIDAASWWFNPTHKKLAVCTGGIGGLPGGRPGGFSDYSQLPSDQYTCVVMYKNRAFWLSEKALIFSTLNNIFSYPGRNIAACPTGAFKGALVQAYYGQADQDARLVIFSTNGTYIGKFTGNLTEYPVQVSTTSVANFGLDGSDFVINAWTSVSAFSHRAAVVAEGVLYFWGPDGIYQDDGVQPIMAGRISQVLEPDLFNLYDPSTTDDIHCSYNATTKEVTWYYKPLVADGNATHALTWNRTRNTWLPQAFIGQIDQTQPINIRSKLPTAGKRLLAFGRDTATANVQRAYFLDYNNRSGDIFPTRELMVKSFTTPLPGVRRMTLAAGYDATKFGTIAVGDPVAIQQLARYATSLAVAPDFVGKVAAVGSGTIDVTLPTGLAMDASATLANNSLYFPLYHQAAAAQGINGFTYALDTDYWCPAGLGYWGHWLHMHMIFKMQGALPSVQALTTTLSYRTPVSDVGPISDTLTFANNSDLNFQVLKSMRIGDQNIEGQGLRFNLSGIQIAAAWMLQYLCAYTRPIDGHQLSIFEE